MTVLTEADRAFFEENGYVKLSGVVPEADCDAVVDAAYDYLGQRPDDPESWYEPPDGLDEPFSSTGMVELYHHQALWDTRQHPDVYEAFTELLGEDRLRVSIDRCNVTPPVREDHPELDDAFVHWDVDTADLPSPLPTPYGVQGVLYLEDTAENQGGFQCVPSIYRDLEEWLDAQPADRDPRRPDLDGHEVEPIPGEKGDLLVWDRLPPHGNGHNRADEPRFAQYILMYPAEEDDEEQRRARVESWREREAPPGDPFPGDPRQREKENPVAELTPLGRKLLGVDSWDD